MLAHVCVAGRHPPPGVARPPPPSPPPLPPGQCYPIMADETTGLPARLELLKSRGVNDSVNGSLALSSADALASLQAPDQCTLVRTLALQWCRLSPNQAAAAAQGNPREGSTKSQGGSFD